MTLRKTLIGACASIALLLSLFIGIGGDHADAQGTETATATPVPTATPEAGETPSLDAVLAVEEDDGENIGDAFAVDTPNPQPSTPLPPAGSPDGTATADATAETDATATTDATTGATTAAPAAAPAPAAAAPAAAETTDASAQPELAFTGPNTGVIVLGLMLLSLGAAFVATSRRQRERMAFEQSLLE